MGFLFCSVFMNMKFKISEKRLLKVIYNFLNNHFKNEYVDSYGVDYDKMFDRVVVNIFFKKGMDKKATSEFYTEIIDAVEGYFGRVPFIYSHISKNYSTHSL